MTPRLKMEKKFSTVLPVLEPARGDVLARGMIDAAMTVKLASYTGVDRAFVGHEMRGAVDVHNEQGADVRGRHVGDVEASDVAVALD